MWNVTWLDKVPLSVQAMQYAPTVWVEADDALTFEDNEEITLMKWGNIILQSKETEGDKITSFTAQVNVAGDFKKTKKKITWVAQTEDTIPVVLVEFDFLITKPKIEEDEDFMKFINPSSKAEV
jgi:glutamyl-tRNA synthetase